MSSHTKDVALEIEGFYHQRKRNNKAAPNLTDS